ncbi:MAG: hypothetical protein ACHQD9_01465 [Chitinophagales bacterium]
MKKIIASVVAVITVATIMFTSSCQKESSTTPGSSFTSSEKVAQGMLFPSNAPAVYGHTYNQWITAWWQWDLQFDCNHFPTFDTDGSLQNQNQSGPVFFLAGSRHNATLSVTVPAGVSIFLPLATVENDYPCGDAVLDSLTSYTNDFVSGITDLSLTIDGNSIKNLTSYQKISSMFTYAANADLANCFDDCITGSDQQWVVGGYFFIFRPLTPGSHTIVRHAVAVGGAVTYDTVYNITQL